ncbi:MAG TPA: FtsX-like permease family protein [Steroidobacteraceae bacterium]|nr:FtsX-like permease family protein [Steroidobacteraceae bacterium]
MSLLSAASLRHLLRHPAQLLLALLGLALGVATIVSVDIATASSRRAFELSMDAVNGPATHQIIAGPQGVDEQVYARLRTTGNIPLAPVVEGYVTIGDRSMLLVGVDPFAGVGLSGAADGPKRPDPAGWLIRPGAVVLSSTTARQLGLSVGRSFNLTVAGSERRATLVEELRGQHAGYDTVLFTDIAQAQEWLGSVGRLSRIEVHLPAGRPGDAAAARLRGSLPPGLQLVATRGRARESLDMTAAFTTNLQAMSLLALLVSTLLIYGSVSFAVVQRRRIIGIVRALGATRGDVGRIVLLEAAILGLIGAGCGVVAGILIAHALIGLVSRTINDLYFVVAVKDTALPTWTIAKALSVGIGTALVAALLPAIEVTNSPPQLGLRRSVLEMRAVHAARRLAVVSFFLAIGAGLIIFAWTRSLLAGFIALFLLLLSVAAITPAVLRALAQLAARLVGRSSPIIRLALADIAASLSRTAVAVAALGMAIAAMIGVSIMVESFRESLREWLTRTMRADVYVTAPGPGAGRPERRLDPQVIEALVAVPGVVDYSLSRRVSVELPDGPVSLDALKPAHASFAAVPLTSPNPQRTWKDFARGDIIVSEPLAWRLQLSQGDLLTLNTAIGPRSLRIAGIYRDYGNDRGNILMSLARYRGLWHDEGTTGMGLYLAPGSALEASLAALQAAVHGRQALLMRSNRDLRDLSMSIFERTFVITRVLYWLAAGVAAIGLVSALLAWELERGREMAILRALGLTPRGAALLIETQTGFMGLVALLAAIPAGLLTAVVLVDVINRRAFGWRIDLHLTAEQFSNALLLALAAALAAGLYPAWRSARVPIGTDMRDE